MFSRSSSSAKALATAAPPQWRASLARVLFDFPLFVLELRTATSRAVAASRRRTLFFQTSYLLPYHYRNTMSRAECRTGCTTRRDVVVAATSSANALFAVPAGVERGSRSL